MTAPPQSQPMGETPYPQELGMGRRGDVAALKARVEELECALRKAKYALEKDSLCDSERVKSARMIVLAALNPKGDA